MGFLQKIKKTVSRAFGNDYATNKIYRPKEVLLKAKDFKNAEHREEMVEENAVAKNLVVKTANLITQHPPKFYDKKDRELKKIREAWEKKGYNDLLNDVIQATRTHGYCVTEWLNKEFDGRNFMVHDSKDVDAIFYDSEMGIEKYQILETIRGLPETAGITAGYQRYLYSEDVIHYYVGKFDRSLQGLSVLKPIWQDLVKFGEIKNSMSDYDARIGNGILTVAIPENSWVAYKNKIEQQLSEATNRGFVVLPKTAETSADMNYLGATGTKTDFTKHLTFLLKIISSSSGFPVRYLIGNPEGALQAAKEDTRLIYNNLKSIFKEYVPYIRKVLLDSENGETLNDKVARIEFDPGDAFDFFEEEDQKQKEVDLIRELD